jgi:hypothetical protein
VIVMTGSSVRRNPRQHRAVASKSVYHVKSSPFLFIWLGVVACTTHQPKQPPLTLSPDRDALLLRRRTDTRLQPITRVGLLALHRVLIHALGSREETALPYRAPAHPARKSTTRDPIDTATVHAWTWEPTTRDSVDAATMHACAWQSATRNPVDAAAVHACAWKQPGWASLPVSTSVTVAPTFARDGAARVCELLGEGGHVRDGVCGGVLGAYVGHARVGSFAGFGEGVVARVEVFAFLVKGWMRLERSS